MFIVFGFFLLILYFSLTVMPWKDHLKIVNTNIGVVIFIDLFKTILLNHLIVTVRLDSILQLYVVTVFNIAVGLLISSLLYDKKVWI